MQLIFQGMCLLRMVTPEAGMANERRWKTMMREMQPYFHNEEHQEEYFDRLHAPYTSDLIYRVQIKKKGWRRNLHNTHLKSSGYFLLSFNQSPFIKESSRPHSWTDIKRMFMVYPLPEYVEYRGGKFCLFCALFAWDLHDLNFF